MASTTAYADVLPSDTTKAYDLDQVVVTGTRTPKTLANTPVVTRVITAEDIKLLDATNIKDVLVAEIPGLEFSYSMNQQVSMQMQGLGGMSILILIDGERLAGETLDNTDFQRLNMDNIDHIEIVKGAASALYGSNSVGAVINIITKTNSDPWSLHFDTRFGTRYDEQRHSGLFSTHSGKTTNFFNVQYDKIGSYTVTDEDGVTQTPVYGTHQWNFKDKLIYEINDKHKLTARGGYYFHERNSSEIQKDRARDFSGGLKYDAKFSEKDALSVNYSYDRYDKSNYYTASKKDILDYKNIQNTLRAIYSHTFNDNVIATVGGDAMIDYLKSYQFTDDGHEKQYTADLFGQADWTISKNWEVIAGLRGDYFSKAGWQLTPKLSAMYKTGGLKLRGSYSKGFRTPTLKEMYMDFNMANIFNIYGNRDLKSEKTNSFSASAEYLLGHYCFTVTGYYNILDNEITTIWNQNLDNGRGAMRYANIEGTNLASIDAVVAARYPFGLCWRVNYSFFHEYTRHNEPNTSDSRPHSMTCQVSYKKNFTKNYNLSAVITGRYLSAVHFYTYGQDYSSYLKTSSPAYQIWKLTVMQKFFDFFTLTATVDNLFGYKPKQYQYNSVYTKGATFYIGAAIDIDKLF